jgi:uncharacterized protein (TIGR02231 family)
MKFLACLFGVYLLMLPGTVLAVGSDAPAQPQAAFFYPDEVRLEVTEKLQAQSLTEVGEAGGLGFILTLPFKADKNTFSATVNGEPAAGAYWLEDKKQPPRPLGDKSIDLPLPNNRSLMDPANEPLPERKAILEKLIPLRVAIAEKSGRLASIQYRIQLLKRQLESDAAKGKKLSSSDLTALDKNFSRILPDIYTSHEQTQRELYNLRQSHDALQEELDKFDAARKFSYLIIPAENSAADAEIKYSYSVGASYSMEYRLLAYPDKKELLIEQDATLRQDSGFAWQNVDVVISTTGRDRRLQPAIPGVWKITSEQPAPASSARALQRAAPLMVQEELAPNSADMLSAASGAVEDVREPVKRPAPVQEQRSTFRVWKLGRQGILADTPVRVQMSSEKVPAAFYYTLRPADYFRAFLTAELSLQQPLELARGTARYFVDDVLLGENIFSFNGTKGSIFFGTDPQVTGVMRSLKRSTGESGFISKEKTMSWNWEITVSSARAYPVEVRVEDAAPEIADEKLTLQVTSDPKAELAVTALNQGSVKIYRWTATLKPDVPFVIRHNVLLSAPVDKNINPGRGEK